MNIHMAQTSLKSGIGMEDRYQGQYMYINNLYFWSNNELSNLISHIMLDRLTN